MTQRIFIFLMTVSLLISIWECTDGMSSDSQSHSNKKCEEGVPYNATQPLLLTGNVTESIVLNNASSLTNITVIILADNCSTLVLVHDCNSGVDYNITVSYKSVHYHQISKRNIHPGDTYILSFSVQKNCEKGITFVVLKLPDIPVKSFRTIVTTTGEYISTIQPSKAMTDWNKLGGTSYTEIHISDLTTNKINVKTSGNINFYTDYNNSSGISFHREYLTTSQKPNIGTIRNKATVLATTVLPHVLPLKTSFENQLVFSTVSLSPTNVNHTIHDSYTDFIENSTDEMVLTTLGVTTNVEVETDKEKKKVNVAGLTRRGNLVKTSQDKPNSTIALGVTIALFALAVIIIGMLIVRVLYKTKRDGNVKSDDNTSVFCSNDFVMHSTGFINEVPTVVATPDFIKIRKVSDSNTDEMMEIDENRYNSGRYDESSHEGSYKRHNPDFKYAGLTGFKKYPAPQPNKSSNYVANRNSRLTSFQSDSDHYQYKRH